MSLVRLENVWKSFSGAPVLRGVGLRVETGDKIGLVGRNGTGKTTIFRLILGETEPDSGVIERMRKARFAYLSQIPQVDPTDTILDISMGPFRDLLEQEAELANLEHRLVDGDVAVTARYSALQEDFHAKGGYDFRFRVKRVLQGLGFHENEFELAISALSGGQRTRLMLALVLLEDADLLLLDEPENHLDIEAREWLETFLKETAKAVVVISHDRRFLAAVPDQIAEVARGELRVFAGNYENYCRESELLREQHQEAFDRQQRFIEQQERWIERFRYKATKATQVQSRVKRLEKLERIEAPPPDARTVRLALDQGAPGRGGGVVRSGQVVVDAKDLAMAYADLRLYEGFSLQVERGERVGIIGPNGSGKTTLLRHLAGRLEEGRGHVALGHKVQLGFYEQHHENVNPANDILAEIMATRPDMLPEQIRTFMGRFLFRGDDIFKPISALSGGELSRVAIAKLILGGANLLLLDEPTNHLDIASREVLEDALDDFPGTLLVVSHDRALIDRLVSKLVIIEHGKAKFHLGNYSDYKWRQSEGAGAVHPDGRAQKESTVLSRPTDDVMKVRREARPAQRQRRDQTRIEQRESRKRRDQFAELERDIEGIEEQITDIESQFAATDPAAYETLHRLKQEYDGLKRDLAEMYAEWEELAKEIS